MTRDDFHKRFRSVGPVVLPVIHVIDAARTLGNIATAVEAGAAGVFLINHDFGPDDFLPIIRRVRASCPSLWLGVNFLGVTGRNAFPVLSALAGDGAQIDAYWADDACIDEHGEAQPAASAIAQARHQSGWDGLYFGGTAFKKQRPVAPEDHEAAASRAVAWMDVVTTSGIATGAAADAAKIAAFRRGVGEHPLALASGITPENARAYGDVDAFLVATGINRERDFYTIDPDRLSALLAVTRALGAERLSAGLPGVEPA